MNKYFCEFLGTFALVFAGTGAIVINDHSGGVITHLGIALTFGMVVMAMIYTIGDVSGAHINPAVTVTFWLAKRLSGKEVAPYIISQLLGGCSPAPPCCWYLVNTRPLGPPYRALMWSRPLVLR